MILELKYNVARCSAMCWCIARIVNVRAQPNPTPSTLNAPELLLSTYPGHLLAGGLEDHHL